MTDKPVSLGLHDEFGAFIKNSPELERVALLIVDTVKAHNPFFADHDCIQVSFYRTHSPERGDPEMYCNVKTCTGVYSAEVFERYQTLAKWTH